MSIVTDPGILSERLVAAYRATIGLAYPDPAYEQFMFPTDQDPWRHEAAKSMWSCGLEIRGGLHACSVFEPEVVWPYEKHIGQIAMMLQAMLDRHDLWHGVGTPDSLTKWWDEPVSTLSGGLPYGEGWMFAIGGSPPFGGAEHFFAVLDTDGESIVSADGGQVDANGHKCVKQRRRVLQRRSDGSLWALDADGDHSPQQPGGGRRVYGVGQLPGMPFDDGVPDTIRPFTE